MARHGALLPPGDRRHLKCKRARDIGRHEPPSVVALEIRLPPRITRIIRELVSELEFWCHTCCRSRPGRRLCETRSVRKQYHFWKPADGTGLDAWDVDRLIALSIDLEVEDVPLDSIEEIDSAYWFDGDLRRPTVRSVVDHVRLINEVDTGYPIILGPDGRVMDGMHRIARALLENRATVRAVHFSELPEPDHRNCEPSQLSYER